MTAAWIRTPLSIALFLLIVWPATGGAAGQTVSLPVTIDYPLLRTLIVGRAFPEDGDSATLIDEGGGCINLVLSDPQVAEESGMLRLETRIFIRAGTPLGGTCYAPVQWQGYLALHQRPLIAAESWQLSFTTVGSELLGVDRQPARIAGMLWKLVESQVFSYLDGISIDLMPPVSGLKEFLLPLFPPHVQAQTTRMLASLRPGEISVEPDSVRFEMRAEVEAVYDPETAPPPDRLEGEALERLVTVWENWDALLGYLVTTLSQEILTEDERQILVDVLLDTRYQFVADLAEDTITRDFVRDQFVGAWRRLAPIFRNHLYRGAGVSQALGYLAFVSSADALLVFDRLGPTFGLEISRNGLVHLARMLSADPALLRYHPGVSPELRRLFELDSEGPTPLPPEPAAPENEGRREQRSATAPLLGAAAFLSGSLAYAAQPSYEEIIRWKVPDREVSDYVRRVGALLDKSSGALLEKDRLPAPVRPMFRLLIPAMAWQESCFRQFVVKGNQLTYLLSYNQSSVGLMQVNERVWRGLYERERLRWEIAYNADAGCEIAALYLKKYALRDPELAATMDNGTLARLVYAMYNGGPGQYRKFLERLRSERFYRSDELFWEKYGWVSAGAVDKVGICLTGS